MNPSNIKNQFQWAKKEKKKKICNLIKEPKYISALEEQIFLCPVTFLYWATVIRLIESKPSLSASSGVESCILIKVMRA